LGQGPVLAPENETAWKLWNSLQTQWRIGFSGATGLDYQAVDMVARVQGIRLDRVMLEKIQALEGAQLKRWAEIRTENREKGEADGR